MQDVCKALIYRKGDDAEVRRKRLGYMHWFCDTFPQKEFRGEEYILRAFMEYCVKLDVDLNSKYLPVFLDLYLTPIFNCAKV